MAELNAKQQRFVEEYLVDLNATQAAIRAGYSPRSASAQGSRLLGNGRVGAAVAVKMAERSRRTGINQDRVVRELARIAFVNAANLIDLDEAALKAGAAGEDAAAIQTVRVKRTPTRHGDIVDREVRLNDKIRALELLGRHLALFTDKLDVREVVVEKTQLATLLDQLELE